MTDRLEYLMSSYERAQLSLTPSAQQQVKLVLEGKCPHNKGWIFHSHGHNDTIYRCNECGKFEFY